MRGTHHGIGLVRYALDYAITKGAGKVSVGVIDEQAELKDWYRHLGFIETEIRDFSHLPFRVCFMETDLKESTGP
jgi:predicted GNAT family N-acyltransferase